MSPPAVSVIVPCRDAAAWIGETVESVRAQDGVAVDLIVVDDGSEDGSVEEATRAAGGQLCVIRQPASGVSRARNAGTTAATAPFVQYLDADDILMPGTLAARVEALERFDGDVAYCDWQRWCRQPDGTFGAGGEVTHVLSDRPELDMLGDAWWPPGALLYRRAIVDRILPWREDLPIIQDARFQQDAALAGGRFVHVPWIGMRYRVHDGVSLSRRDPVAFFDDCLRNLDDLAERWEADGTLDVDRRRALLGGYSTVVRSYFPKDRVKFDAALARARRLDPHFVPAGPPALRALSRAVGYRAAEHVAAAWRAVKARAR